MRVLFTQKEIAERTGASQPMISYILNGDRSPSPAMAESLEEATGICAPAWIWPERCWNPYIPFANPIVCGRCDHRAKRYPIIFELCFKAMEENPNEQGLDDCLEIIRTMNNWPRSVFYGWREVKSDGLHLITGFDSDYKPDDVITSAYCTHSVGEGKAVFHPFLVNDIYMYPDEMERMKATGMKSGYMFPSHGLVLTLATFDDHLILDDTGLSSGMEFVQEIHHILRSSTNWQGCPE